LALNELTGLRSAAPWYAHGQLLKTEVGAAAARRVEEVVAGIGGVATGQGTSKEQGARGLGGVPGSGVRVMERPGGTGVHNGRVPRAPRAQGRREGRGPRGVAVGTSIATVTCDLII
jgi:hypothetical protein